MTERHANEIDPELARAVIDGAEEMAVITTDEAARVTSWNPGAENLLGWPAAQAIGMDAREIFTPEDREAGADEDELKRAVGEGRSVDERWHVRRDGSRFWASGLLMPLRDRETGRVRGFVKIVRDRTAERESDRRYHAMTAALPGFVFVADTDGNNVETNAYFQAYAGRSAAELNGDRWLEVLHDADRSAAAESWAHAVRTGDPYEGRFRFRSHDGAYRTFTCRGVPERDEDGRIVRWMGACIDVENEARARAAMERLTIALEHSVTERDADLATAIENLTQAVEERNKAEDALRQAQKMEAVGQLTGGVAHDFNNLLTVIRASVDLLRKRDLSEERRRRYIDAIAETTDRAAMLTKQLLAFARRQPLQPEVFDVSDRLAQVTPMLKTTIGSRIRLVTEVECAPCTAEADPNQFDTAILNMVVNARDAMNGEGAITIRVARVDAIPARRSHDDSPGDYIEICVQDTGCGIDPDTLEQIFEPFFTTKEIGKGTGLGLSQVFGFAKQSGGDVTVESVEGAGTTFRIFLPYSEHKARAELTAPSAPAAVDGGGDRGCVLIVEDNDAVGEFAAQLLQDVGYSTVWVNNAKKALATLATRPDAFDVVFADVMMPGMNGVEMAREIRVRFPGLPVILTSGYSDVLAEEGTYGFTLLSKPYTVEALSRALRMASQGRRPRA